MSVSGDYANPVWVNGYQCWNCADVDNAKKFIDPAHPNSGPFNIRASTDPSRALHPPGVSDATPAGAGQGRAQAPGDAQIAGSGAPAPWNATTGGLLDLTV